jgi:hypothetical protein
MKRTTSYFQGSPKIVISAEKPTIPRAKSFDNATMPALVRVRSFEKDNSNSSRDSARSNTSLPAVKSYVWFFFFFFFSFRFLVFSFLAFLVCCFSCFVFLRAAYWVKNSISIYQGGNTDISPDISCKQKKIIILPKKSVHVDKIKNSFKKNFHVNKKNNFVQIFFPCRRKIISQKISILPSY